MKELADELGEERQNMYQFRSYCIENEMIEAVSNGRYCLTSFGKRLLKENE